MDAAIIIPARYQSSRFQGKPLAKIKGATGIDKTLIARCVEAARLVPGATQIAVATDDHRIAGEVATCGAEVVMTADSCRNGSERVAEAAAKLNLSDRIVVNLQGDAPLTPPSFMEAIVASINADPEVRVATPVTPFAPGQLNHVRRELAAGRKGPTAVVFAANRDALYFSKQLIPSLPDGDERAAQAVFHHLGLYAYRPEALADYAAAGPTPLELTEGLEQLRFLERGTAIRTVEIDGRERMQWEVNFPDDIPIIEGELARLGIP